MRFWWSKALCLVLFSMSLTAQAAPGKKPVKGTKPAPTQAVVKKAVTNKAVQAPAARPTATRPTVANMKLLPVTRELLAGRWFWMFVSRTMYTRGLVLRADLEKLKNSNNDLEIKLFKAMGTSSTVQFTTFIKYCKQHAKALKPGLWKSMCKEAVAGKIDKKKAPTQAMLAVWKKDLDGLMAKSPNNPTYLQHLVILLTLKSLTLPWYNRNNASLLKELKVAAKRIQKHKKLEPWGSLGLSRITYLAHYMKPKNPKNRAVLQKLIVQLQKLNKKYPGYPSILAQIGLIANRLKDNKLSESVKQQLVTNAHSSLWHFAIAANVVYRTATRPYNKKYSDLLTLTEKALANSKRLKEPYVALYFAQLLNYRLGWKFKEKALQLFERYFPKLPKETASKMALHYATLLKRGKRYKEAEKILMEQWNRTKDNNLIYQIVSLYRYNLRQKDKAFAFLNSILAKDPNHVEALKRRAYLYKYSNDLIRAEQDYKTLLANPSRLRKYDFSTIASFYRYSKRDMKEAMNVYNIGIKLHPKYYYHYYNRAHLYRAMNKINEAIADYKKSFTLNPRSTYAVKTFTKLLIRQNRSKEALDYIKKRLAKSPKDYYLQLAYVDTLTLLKRTAEAERFMLKSGNVRFLLKIANEAKNKRKYPKALKFYSAYIKAKVKAGSGSYYMYHYRARLYHSMGKTKEALADYRRAIKFRPDYLYTYSSLAYYFRYRLKKPAEALKLWDEYLKRKPKDTNAMFRRASLLATLKNYTAAQQQYEQALSLMKPSVYKLNSVAYFYIWKMKKPKLALQLWNDFIEKNPKNERAYRYRADVYSRLKMYEDAVKDLSKAIDLNPKYYYSYYKLANLYKYNLRKKERALDVWDEYIKRNPKNPQGYTYRAQVYRDLGQFDKAIKDYQNAILLNPSRRSSYSSLAYFYNHYKVKQYDKVPEVWTMFLKKSPWDHWALRERAKSYEKLKKYKLALKDWEKVANSSASVYYRKYAFQGKARCFQALGRHKEAIKLFEDQLKSIRYSWQRRNLNKTLYKSYMAVGRYKDALVSLRKSLYSTRYMNTKTRLNLSVLQAMIGQYQQASTGLQKLCYGRRSYRGNAERAKACDYLDILQYSQSLFKPPFLP